ncbi:MAG: serine hydrolase domain-containing protein [Verrucomicrobiota bacterium]
MKNQQYIIWVFLPVMLLFNGCTNLSRYAGLSPEEALSIFQLEKQMQRYNVPGLSMAVIRDGEIAWAEGYGVLQSGSDQLVDLDTMFSAGSVSKVGTSVVCLRLERSGDLDLKANVNDYLQSWQIPETQFTAEEPVSIYRLASHTAGTTVHGFPDFQPGEALPETVEILQGVAPAKNKPVVVDSPVGSRFRYSGGGTTVIQLVVEDITGEPFYTVAQREVFGPLGMKRSSYRNPLPSSFENVAKAHDKKGQPRALPRGYEAMPEAAASGLWTTPTDLAKMMIALMDAYHGLDSTYLSQSAVRDQMTRVDPSDFGIGPQISLKGGYTRFHHGGANDSYRAFIVGHLESRDGFVILTNGRRGGRLIKRLVPIFTELLTSEDS